MFLEIQSQTSEEVEDEEPMPRPAPKENGRKVVTFRPNLEEYEPEEEDEELLLLHSTSSVGSLESIPELTEVETGAEPTLAEAVDEEALFETLHFLTIDPMESQPEIEIGESEVIKKTEGATPKSLSPVHLADLPASSTVSPKIRKMPAKPKPKERTHLPQLSNTLKFKYCCEQKKLNETLPRYDGGGNSEYGLSKKQLQIKRAQQERKRKYRQEVEFRKYQEEVERCRSNEEAFARWLRKKLVSTPKKNVNRYDDHKTRPSK